MSGEKRNAAVVGVGLLGAQHAEQYRQNAHTRLTLVQDIDPERARAAGDRLDVPWTTSLDAVAASDTEIVSIATPDHLHFDAAATLLSAGKHLLIEKPLTTSSEEAHELVRLAQLHDRRVGVALGQRWNPNLLQIRDSLAAGEIGDPIYAYCRCSNTRWIPEQALSWSSRSGPQWFLFAHTMDFMRWILGSDARTVYATGSKGILAEKGIDCFDAIQAVVQFENTFVTFESSWILPESWPGIVEFEIVLNGAQGRIGFDGVRTGFELSSNQAGKHMFSRPNLWSNQRRPGWWWGPLHDLVDAVNEDRAPMASIEDGAAVVEMICAVEQSIAEGRRVDLAPIAASRRS
jgi:predicted dehydrogenase